MKWLEDEDPHTLGWQGLAIEVIEMAIYERDYYFVNSKYFDFWITYAFDGRVMPESSRAAYLRRVRRAGLDRFDEEVINIGNLNNQEFLSFIERYFQEILHLPPDFEMFSHPSQVEKFEDEGNGKDGENRSDFDSYAK